MCTYAIHPLWFCNLTLIIKSKTCFSIISASSCVLFWQKLEHSPLHSLEPLSGLMYLSGKDILSLLACVTYSSVLRRHEDKKCGFPILIKVSRLCHIYCLVRYYSIGADNSWLGFGLMGIIEEGICPWHDSINCLHAIDNPGKLK